MPLFRGSSRFESLISSHHSRRVTCECDEEDIDDDDDDDDEYDDDKDPRTRCVPLCSHRCSLSHTLSRARSLSLMVTGFSGLVRHALPLQVSLSVTHTLSRARAHAGRHTPDGAHRKVCTTQQPPVFFLSAHAGKSSVRISFGNTYNL